MINKDDVAYIAGLARIHLTDEESASLGKNLEDILAYINKLNELDTEGVEPTSHAMPVKNVFREDVVKPSLSQDDATAFAVEKHKGAFQVPKIIE